MTDEAEITENFSYSISKLALINSIIAKLPIKT